MPTIHLLIRGNVQGVFYRATAKEVAGKLNITGWIKNTEKGDVEALVSGSEESLHQFTEWCKKGPQKASVDEVIVTKQEEKIFREFSVIRGAS